jgi:hypothetical protein
LRIVRKLSKDNSKLSGKIAKPRTRMPAPTLVISVTQHERTPVCPLKNSNAPLAIFVLPIDLRSFILKGVLNEFLINPMAPFVAPPHFSKDEPTRDRSSRDKDGPQMPCFGPDRRRARVQQVMIIAVRHHARPFSKDKSARRDLIARRRPFQTAAHSIIALCMTARPKTLRGGGLGFSNSLA